MVIEKLTAEQEGMLPVYRDKWIRIGTSTNQGSKEEIINQIKAAYTTAGMHQPDEFVFLDDPLQGMLEAQRRLGTPRQYVRPVYGLHDAAWLGFYDFASLLTNACEPLKPIMALAELTGWWWPLSNVCVVTPKPCLALFDNLGRLHCTDGPALAYPSGWEMYMWHGIRLSKEIVMSPVTIDQIKAESNSEIRRIMVERYGYESYINDSGAAVLHKDDWGTLWLLQDNVRVVEVLNSTPEPDGTFKRYFIRVRPGVSRAVDAIASTFRHPNGQPFTEQEYIKLSTIAS